MTGFRPAILKNYSILLNVPTISSWWWDAYLKENKLAIRHCKNIFWVDFSASKSKVHLTRLTFFLIHFCMYISKNLFNLAFSRVELRWNHTTIFQIWSKLETFYNTQKYAATWRNTKISFCIYFKIYYITLSMSITEWVPYFFLCSNLNFPPYSILEWFLAQHTSTKQSRSTNFYYGEKWQIILCAIVNFFIHKRNECISTHSHNLLGVL